LFVQTAFLVRAHTPCAVAAKANTHSTPWQTRPRHRSRGTWSCG
jgi:hypothetical protein